MVSTEPTTIRTLLNSFQNIIQETQDDLSILAKRFKVMDTNNCLIISNEEQKAAFQHFRGIAFRYGERNKFLYRDGVFTEINYRGFVYTYYNIFFLKMCGLLLKKISPDLPRKGLLGNHFILRNARFEKLRDAQSNRLIDRLLGRNTDLKKDEEAAADYIGSLACELGFDTPTFNIATFLKESTRWLQYIFVNHVVNCLTTPHREETWGPLDDAHTPSSEQVKNRICLPDVEYVLSYPEVAKYDDRTEQESNLIKYILHENVQSELERIRLIAPKISREGLDIILEGSDHLFWVL